MASASPSEPFTIDALKFPILDLGDAQLWAGFVLERDLRTETFKLADSLPFDLGILKAEVLQLSQELPPLLEIPSPTITATTSEDETEPASSEAGLAAENWEEIWTLPEVQKQHHENKLVSWDKFLNSLHKECPGYIVESNPHVQDWLALIADKAIDTRTKQVRSDAFLGALTDVGLGRGSAIFQWNSLTSSFENAIGRFTFEDCSQELLDPVISSFTQMGSQMRRLRTFCQGLSMQSSTRNSFAASISACLGGIEQYVWDAGTNMHSILQVRETFSAPQPLINALYTLVGITERSTNDSQLLLMVMEFVEEASCSKAYLSKTLDSVCVRTFQPAIQKLAQETGTSSELVAPLLDSPIQDIFMELGNSIAEIQSNLILFQDTSSSTEFMSSIVQNAPCKSLKLVNTWEEAMSAHENALVYEDYMRSAMMRSQPYQQDGIAPGPVQLPDNTWNRFEFAYSFDPEPVSLDQNFHSVLEIGGTEVDYLQNQTLVLLQGDMPSSDLRIPFSQAVSLSVSPLLNAQQRVLSYTLLQKLYQEHNLLHHLQLQFCVQLLGDSNFASRLSAALFDPNQVSGEGPRHPNAVTGLRLEGRKSWPPSSPELRLVLMGILSESLMGSDLESLNDAMSFAVRDLSDEDLEKCRDAQSIYALDFLRLSYRPPTKIIEAIISGSIQNKYDRIFMHLLRLLRLKAVSQRHLRDSIKARGTATPTSSIHVFCHLVHHFVSHLLAYCHDSAICVPWRKMEGMFQSVQDCLNTADYEGTLALAGSFEQIRDVHESTVDDILRNLLLRGNQLKTRRLLDEILDKVLQFSALVYRSNGIDDNTAACRLLYYELKRKIELFIEILRGIVDEEGHEEVTTLSHLLLSLDISGFYARSDSNKS